MERTARVLLRIQHVLFAGLLLVCGGAAVATGASVLVQALLTLAVVLWYTVGIRVLDPSAWQAEPIVTRVVWLAGLTAGWFLLVALSPSNLWLAFSLWLLAGLLLRFGAAVTYTGVTLGLVILVQVLATGHVSIGEVVGPSVGAVFAIAVSRGQLRLLNEIYERQHLVESLMAAQVESEALHAQLSAVQREAGALAERARLSRDIHDTLAQGLSSILLIARGVAETEADGRSQRMLARIDAIAAENLQEVRRVVADLAPEDLVDAGLVSAVRRLSMAFAEESGIGMEFVVDGSVDGLPTAGEVALLRSAQGVLANVRRHAHATRVAVTMTRIADSVRIDIVDDGIGFDPLALGPSVPGSGGYGLPAVRARMGQLGGGLDVESAPGQGTAVAMYLPLPPTHVERVQR